MIAKIISLLKKTLEYVKLTALYIPQIIGMLENKKTKKR